MSKVDNNYWLNKVGIKSKTKNSRSLLNPLHFFLDFSVIDIEAGRYSKFEPFITKKNHYCKELMFLICLFCYVLNNPDPRDLVACMSSFAKTITTWIKYETSRYSRISTPFMKLFKMSGVSNQHTRSILCCSSSRFEGLATLTFDFRCLHIKKSKRVKSGDSAGHFTRQIKRNGKLSSKNCVTRTSKCGSASSCWNFMYLCNPEQIIVSTFMLTSNDDNEINH